MREMKKALRTQIRSQLSTLLPTTVSQQSTQITAHLLNSKEFQTAKNVSVYVSKQGAPEVSTTQIITEILRSGRGCFIPRCVSKTKMEMVRLNSLSELEALPVNRMGIREPALDEDRENALDMVREGRGSLDLVILPLLAVDRQGWRLGHGAGYYDRFLEEMYALNAQGGVKNSTATIAVALREQIVDESLPRDQYDMKPDFIITADGLLPAKE
ncbi:hypothetical protein CcCBS67573_g03759 [Chytriomyces confervae]|uniref:5-formyltetrahydrofolate cyclo-ligase n=1 Tax=Chytriomyces confervae TaxID=246404 RepID=A0A507FFP3_9FUNG|nr:hypothetical protein CcCBS67573_g03759 [Chytriomyces confervae]